MLVYNLSHHAHRMHGFILRQCDIANESISRYSTRNDKRQIVKIIRLLLYVRHKLLKMVFMFYLLKWFCSLGGDP